MTIDPTTPILVGCGNLTDSDTPAEQGRSPYDLLAAAGRLALTDTGAPSIAGAIDTIAVLRCYADSSHRFQTQLGGSDNLPKSVSDRLGIDPARHVYTWNGGNMPQYLVNQFAEDIVAGRMRAALIVGGEALRTQHGLERLGRTDISWAESPGCTPEVIGDPRRGWNDHEDKHGLRAAIAQYPLFENAIRSGRGASIDEHLHSNARLMASFAKVAAANPLATRREGWSAERIAAVDSENRWIGFPYPRFMVSNAFIDQAAAFILTSVAQARELGIPEAKWVYLHGCADAQDQWYTTQRVTLSRSPAMAAAAARAFEMAGKTIADMQFIDLYSCFPAAVEIACEELGLREDDPRGLTITGGLVYFGGPGNSYVVLSICEMIRRLRSTRGAFGLVTGIGNWVTKHSYGVYSSTPKEGRWEREDPSVIQSRLDAMPLAPFTENPEGAAHIETYTVMHDRNGPSQSIVLGRLDLTGQRFIANTASDLATLMDMQARDSLNRPGTVISRDGLNTFVPT